MIIRIRSFLFLHLVMVGFFMVTMEFGSDQLS